MDPVLIAHFLQSLGSQIYRQALSVGPEHDRTNDS